MTHEQQNVGTCIGEIDFSLTISPDGKLLAYIDFDIKTAEQIVHLLNLNNGETSRAYQCQKACRYKDSDVEFSPDGKYLAITRTLDEGLNEEVFLLDILAKSLTSLTAIKGSIKGLSWHPKNDRIIFSAQVSDQRDGYLFDLKDKKTTKLNISGFSYPNFIPQSNDIIFHHWQVLSSLSSISLQDSVAASPFPYIQSDYSYHSSHYSSVKNKMVFISNESGFDELWMSEVDGTNRKKLTSLERHLTFPRWSHNGKHIAFLGPKKHGNALYILDIKSNIVKKLDSNFEQHFRPSWLQDNSGVIAAVRAEQQTALYAFPITRKAPYLLLNQAVTYAEQTKDGKIWFSPDRNKGLWRFDPQQKNLQVEQILNKDLFRVSYNWELTEQGLYFQHDYAQHHQINVFDLRTKKITPVVKLPKGTLQRVSSITLIPSSNKLIFTQLEFPKVDTKRLTHPLLQ
jgi:Tol biopolymer transport system component